MVASATTSKLTMRRNDEDLILILIGDARLLKVIIVQPSGCGIGWSFHAEPTSLFPLSINCGQVWDYDGEVQSHRGLGLKVHHVKTTTMVDKLLLFLQSSWATQGSTRRSVEVYNVLNVGFSVCMP